MNKFILDTAVQQYINTHLNADVNQIALAKSPFTMVSSKELSIQIKAKKKAEKKLPTWFNAGSIYYPEPLSIEQCSSETTAAYKASLFNGGKLIDLTGGFGVDSYYFAKKASSVLHCEINQELAQIAAHNVEALQVANITFLAGDGLAYLKTADKTYDTIYIDPARRSNVGKVFMLKDCTPNVVENLDLLLNKASKVIVKTSPLLDITAGLKELNHVTEVHIVSTKNECKELLFVMEKTEIIKPVKITSVTINDNIKQFSFFNGEKTQGILAENLLDYIYEPDVALLKSGGFSLIGERYELKKLQEQTQLYTSNEYKPDFPGRIFKVNEVISAADLKKIKNLSGNVLVRNYPEQAEILARKYKIKAGKNEFYIFTQMKASRLLIIKATILQHY
ncbi:16S rRNA G966 N2-methylase RsmD [Pedobacter sp. CG_S7]|uniref:class I SAM-dependent methyltransferase n=1 Tax=Pedobacter sp. CG_S7 TaxID=3143930 RepID=UPI00339B7E9B